MLTLDPPLVNTEHGNEANSGGYTCENVSIVKRAVAFEKAGNKDYGRSNVIVPTLAGDRCLINRFLCAQKPPPEVASISEVARYVSLVPFVEDCHLFVGKEDMWCTTAQFLEICAGDWEEHSVALRNMFAHVDAAAGTHESYLVFGNAVPEGETIYVLRRPIREIRHNITLWDASTGLQYALGDSRCPLQTISMLADEKNCYINKQSTGIPTRMEFDLNNRAHWLPFFSEKFPLPHGYNAIQPTVTYIPTAKSDVDGLERQILETIKIDMKEWRSKSYQTYLNQSAARDMRRALESFEAHKRGQEGYSEYDHLANLKKWTTTYAMTGYPLNFPFADVKTISYAVKDTGLHLNENPTVKFAVTVKCFAYSCGVISVWVYVAALIRK